MNRFDKHPQNKKLFSSEDILAVGQDHVVIDGVQLRKGTIAAALKNADIIEAIDSTQEEIEAAYNFFKDNAQGLILIGLYKHLQWKNPKIQEIIDDYYKNYFKK